MRAGIWHDIGDIRCGEWDEPEPGPQDVLVEVGDRVACNLYAYCGACAWCRSGQPNMCRRKRFSAQGFAEYARYREEQVFRLPDHVSLEAGAFLEPVATIVNAIDVGEVRPGEHVLVIGGGPIGLICAQLARRAGAASVTVSEPRARNRDLALRLGADRAVDPTCNDLQEIAKSTGSRRGFDVVFEVAGSPPAATLAPELAATRGRVVIVGVFDTDVTIPIRPYLLYEKEIAVRGAYAASHTFERGLGLLAELELVSLISGIEPLERISDAYAAHKAGEHVKVLLTPQRVDA